MLVDDLKSFAKDRGIQIKNQDEIVKEAIENINSKYNYSIEEIKNNFDQLLYESEVEAYRIYLESQKIFGKKALGEFIDYLYKNGKCNSQEELKNIFGDHFDALDKFFLSIAQARKARAGKTFEKIHNTLFKKLSYPFTEQAVINGKPDFVMPSVAYYRVNPLNCIIFTAKRTLRERWRQIVTEGTRGIGFYLATIDKKISGNQLQEMMNHRIFLVVPKNIKDEHYSNIENVLSFRMFFEDHLDSKFRIWERNGLI
jgi:hypothetical protein